MGELRAACARARRADGAEFAFELRLFVRRLLLPTAPQLHAQWEATLAVYELTPPAGTHLILSAPGRYSTSRAPADAACRPPHAPHTAEADLYGLRALRRHLQRGLAARPPSELPVRVEYACSSLGQLDDILQPLLNVRPPGSVSK
eukprot:4245287-Prymnesium_polylepis.1